MAKKNPLMSGGAPQDSKSSRVVKSKNPHTALIKEILYFIPRRYDAFVWQNSSGAYKIRNHFIRFGLKGSADIIGLNAEGRFIAIEVKTGAAILTKEQKTFRAEIERLGGIYILARSVSDVCYGLDWAGDPPPHLG